MLDWRALAADRPPAPLPFWRTKNAQTKNEQAKEREELSEPRRKNEREKHDGATKRRNPPIKMWPAIIRYERSELAQEKSKSEKKHRTAYRYNCRAVAVSGAEWPKRESGRTGVR